MSGAEQLHHDQAGLRWRKSTFSSIGNCVEVASDGDAVMIRDSKDPAGVVLRYTSDEWNAFLRGAKHGEFDDLP